MAVRLRTRGSSGLAVYKVKKKKKKKRRSREMKGIERMVRRGAMADSGFSKRYLREHRKSNRKKKDGWARDFSDNIYKAGKRGRKKLKIRRLLRL